MDRRGLKMDILFDKMNYIDEKYGKNFGVVGTSLHAEKDRKRIKKSPQSCSYNNLKEVDMR